MTIVYETQKRRDGLFQWRRLGDDWQLARDLDEAVAAIRRDADNAQFQIRYTGKFL